MRVPLIAGNWKMHKTTQEAVQFVQALLPYLAKNRVWIAPPFTALYACTQAAKGSALQIGGQNLNENEAGAFTGEISGRMLIDVGASFVIIGHSERRHVFHETDLVIRKKIDRAFLSGLIPLLCIGETAEEHRKKNTQEVLNRQLDTALQGVSHQQMHQLIIAYEPVWAIGSGQSATPQLAQEMHQWIRHYLGKHFDPSMANQVTLLYGGSVNPANLADLLAQPDIDGVLVGGASLDAPTFIQMIQMGNKT